MALENETLTASREKNTKLYGVGWLTSVPPHCSVPVDSGPQHPMRPQNASQETTKGVTPMFLELM